MSSRVVHPEASPKITNALRGALGITIPTESRSTAALPSTQPMATIVDSKPLRQTVQFVDEDTPPGELNRQGSWVPRFGLRSVRPLPGQRILRF